MSIKRQTSKDSLASLGSENKGDERINESPDSSSSFSFSTNTTNSSFDMEELLKAGFNQLRNQHSVKTETFLQSFESPQPNGPFCSSRNNSTSKIKMLDELPFPDISPIARSSVLFNGTFTRGTLRHSIDRTDSTLRRKSHSVSGHEKWFDETILPLGQRSESSSLNTSPRQELNLACLAPRNTPEVHSSISSPEENWKRHSLGELQRENTNDTQMNRGRPCGRSRNVGRTGHNTPVNHHSNRVVDEWLNQNPTRSNIRNLNVSDFDVDTSSSNCPSIAHFDAYDTGAFYPNDYMQYVGYPPPYRYNPCHMGGHWDHPPMCPMCQPPLQHFHPVAPYYYPMPHPTHLGHFHANTSIHGGYNNNVHDHRQQDDQSGTSKPPSSSQKTSRKSNRTAAHGHQRRVRVSKKNIQAMRSLKKKICNGSSSSIKVKTLANM